jgi:hypothetical protein
MILFIKHGGSGGQGVENSVMIKMSVRGGGGRGVS